MTPLAFFRTPEAQRLLARAARCAAMPLSLHYVDDGREGPRILGWGQCAACRYVHTLKDGPKSCRGSRVPPSSTAVQRGKPVPFICHMGFACVSVPALPKTGEGFVLTFGPYNPAEAPDSLHDDARKRLHKMLGAPVSLPASSKENAGRDASAPSGSDCSGDLPEWLADIRTTSADAVPELAAWTAESLDALWDGMQEEAVERERRHPCRQAVEKMPAGMPAVQTIEAPVAEQPARSKLRKVRDALDDPYQSNVIAAALAGGSQPQARALLRAVLAEAWSGKRVKLAVKRGRTVAAVAAVLEACERAKAATAESWERFSAGTAGTLAGGDINGDEETVVAAGKDAGGPSANPSFALDVSRARTDAELLNAAMGVLSGVRRAAQRTKDSGLIELNRLIQARLLDGITLGEASEALGQTPGAITHRLKRAFGMSFTQYANRLRIEKAKELLRRTQLSAGAVARRVGISDAANFAKLFRKFEGMAPLDYRSRFGVRR